MSPTSARTSTSSSTSSTSSSSPSSSSPSSSSQRSQKTGQYATGRKHSLPLVPVELWEYSDLYYAHPVLAQQTKQSLDILPLSDILPDDLCTGLRSLAHSSQALFHGKLQRIQDKWVYFFMLRSWGAATLEFEIEAKVSGNAPQYTLVSWTPNDKPKWHKTYPRQATSPRKTLHLHGGETYYALVSRVQLPLARLDFYSSAKGLPALKARALEVAKPSLPQCAKILQLPLVDHLTVAEKAAARYEKALTEQQKFFGDETNNLKRYMAQFIQDLSKKEKKFDDWVRMGDLRKYLRQQDTALKNLAGAVDASSAFLRAWQLLPGYEETREDYTCGDKKYEALEKSIVQTEASLLNLALANRYGLAYLLEHAKEHTWYYRLFFHENAYVAKKILIAFSEDDCATLLNNFLIGRFLHHLPELGLAKTVEVPSVHKVQRKILIEIERIRKVHGWAFVDFGNRKGIIAWTHEVKTTGILRIQYEIENVEVTPVHMATPKWDRAIRKVGASTRNVIFALEAINLISGFSKLRESSNAEETAWNAAELASSCADSVGALSSLVGNVWSNKSLLHGFLGKAAIVGGILDFVLNLRSAAQAWADGKIGLASGHIVTALAAATLTAGSAAALSTSGVILGLTATSWTIVGAILLLIGTALIYYFTESDMEEWAEDCFWGIDWKGGTNISKAALEKQVERLHEILSQYQSECYILAKRTPLKYLDSQGHTHNIYEYFIVLDIVTGMFLEGKSKFDVKLFVQDYGTALTTSDNKILIPSSPAMRLPDKESIIGRTEDGKAVRRISRYWSLSRPNIESRARMGKYEYEYTIQLDFKGDGSTKYPAKPARFDGTLKVKSR